MKTNLREEPVSCFLFNEYWLDFVMSLYGFRNKKRPDRNPARTDSISFDNLFLSSFMPFIFSLNE